MITPLYLESRAAKERLRIAVLLDGPRIPRYVATILDDIARSNFARVELALVAGPDGASSAADEALRLVRSARDGSLAQEIYTMVDRRMGDAEDPLGIVDRTAWLADGKRLDLPPAAADGRLTLPAEAIAEIERRQIDVILRFCTALPTGEVLRAARYGVWSYHYGADEIPRGGMPFFREVASGASTVDVLLEVLADEPGAGLLLCRSTIACRVSIFMAAQRGGPMWETTHFVLWKLHDVHERGWDHVRQQALPRAFGAGGSGPAPAVTAAEIARFLWPRVVNGVSVRAKGGLQKPLTHWRIGLRRTRTPLGANAGHLHASGFNWIQAPRGHAWADPFLVDHGGKTLLFIEDFLYERSFAGLACAEVLDDGTLGPLEPCLDTGRHLSFPYVFEHQGEMFMLPESAAAGTVTLYRARRFPHEWVEEKVLFRGNAVDTVFIQHNGLFYFFTTVFDRDDRGAKTVVFLADSLTGAWRLHPQNPVSSDVRNARGAGAIFRHEGRLFRPAQDCGVRYGYGFNLNEIVTLSDDRYEERLWCRVDPSSLTVYATGVHTYNRSGDLEVIDSCVSAPPSELR